MAPLTESRAEYMNKLCEGDVFLDTPHFNAHTTAVDAVWVGVPMITEATEKMAGRVASSILASAGLSLLISRNQEDYQAMVRAVSLPGPDRQRVQSGLRDKVAAARGAPLFNSGHQPSQSSLVDLCACRHSLYGNVWHP